MERLEALLCRIGSEVLFLPKSRLGIVILIVALAQPYSGLTATVALVASWGLARFLSLDPKAAKLGFYWYNPLLVGLSVGYYIHLSPASILLAALAGAMTLLVCIATSYLLREFFTLPVLSLPFALGSTLVYLVCLRYPGLEWQQSCVSLFPRSGPEIPAVISGYFTALGMVFFISNPWAGMILSGILAWHSRILFFLSLFGYGVGVSVRVTLAGTSEGLLADPNGFNFILSAMALGSVFLVPSMRSYLVAALGAAFSAIVLDAWIVVGWGFGNGYALPPFSLPFNVAVLGVLYSLRLAEFPEITITQGRIPEETLELNAVNRVRYPGSLRAIHLPFSGAWTVWQAFDGRWTHQGAWRFAYDFYIADRVGKTYQDSGAELTDYFCFRKPVLSPIAGRVVRVIRHLPDQPIGQSDRSQGWGNAVVLEDPRGFYVEISHFSSDSIRVVEGQELACGTIIGLCGNSGYSPQPHIHIQVQATDEIGAITLPFSFACYVVGECFYANHFPEENTTLKAAWPKQTLDAATDCPLEHEVEYEVVREGDLVARLSLCVRMAVDGAFYFESKDGSRLYFGKYAGTFYFYRLDGSNAWLRLLFMALPRLPIAQQDGLRWEDFLPLAVVYSGWRRFLLQLASIFQPSLAVVSTAHRFVKRDVVETRVDGRLGKNHDPIQIVLGTNTPIASVSMGNIEMRCVAPIHQCEGDRIGNAKSLWIGRGITAVGFGNRITHVERET